MKTNHTISRSLTKSILYLSLFAPGFAVASATGTLPLKLAGGGTIPLKLAGESRDISGGLDEVSTSISLTEVIQDPMSMEERRNLPCLADNDSISKHKAGGVLFFGGERSIILGICYNHETKAMEIVARGQSGLNSIASGLLRREFPVAFSGRLIVNTEGARAKRFILTTAKLEGRR
jgi:hypothetical protein